MTNTRTLYCAKMLFLVIDNFKKNILKFKLELNMFMTWCTKEKK